MRNYYIFKSGRIRRKENTIFFEYRENGHISKKSIPVEDIKQIFFFGEVDLNSKFLDFASHNGIFLHFFNYYGFYTGSFCPRSRNESGYVIVKQVEHYLDYERRMKIAKKIVLGALANTRRILEKRSGFEEAIDKIKYHENQAKSSQNIINLMSHEANAKKIYYSEWERITGWKFTSREFHPPSNEINALISFGNSLLYTIVLKELYLTPLNPTVSYLHEPSEKRYSLSLDLAEIFKPLFVDKLIFKLINRRKLCKEKHFISGTKGTFLNEEGRKLFVKNFDEMLTQTILHRQLKRKVKYQNLIRLEAYKLLKHILGEKEYKPLKVWW